MLFGHNSLFNSAMFFFFFRRFNHTNSARRCRLGGPGSLGRARWRDRVIWDGRFRGFRRGGGFGDVPTKVNLGGEWLQTEEEGTTSCEKLRAVSAVLLVVAVSKYPLEIQIQAKMLKTEILDRTRRSVGRPSFGGWRQWAQPLRSKF